MIVEIDVSELKIGHYVVDIVRQQGTYNLTNSGHVKSEAVVHNLAAKGVETLLIDTSKTLVKTEQNKNKNPLKRETTEPPPVIREIKKAKKLFNESKEIQKKVFEDALHGRELNVAPIMDIAEKTIDTVFKNPDALACVINIRNKDGTWFTPH